MENQQPKFKIWWDEKEGILRNKSWGDFEEEDAKVQAEELLKLAGTKPGKVLVLNDLREAGSASSGARKVYAQLIKNEKFKKGAFVDMKTLTRVIISFITKFSGANNVKYFETEEEAIEWLKE